MLEPRSGARLRALFDDVVREVLERPYRIICRVSAASIEIITVKHYRQRLIDRPDDFQRSERVSVTARGILTEPTYGNVN
jgi:hypothetical protein